MNFNLKGKIALITGSSKGIGLQIAKTLQKEDCKTIINSRDSKELTQTSNSIEGSISIAGDVTIPEEAKFIVNKTIQTYGALDILICNVGSGNSVPVGKETLEEWKRMMSINLYSATNMVEASIEYLEKQRGSIVCISSICGNETIPGAPVAYSTSKSALNAYVKGISRYLATKDIRINAISPGNILFKGSTWSKKIDSNPIDVERMLSREVPLKSFGSPEEVANLVCYLASPLSRFMTGSILTLDGGQVRG